MSDTFKKPDIHKLSVGDTVRMPLSYQTGRRLLEGTVVYIHPKLRFFRVEFKVGDTLIRESYCAYGTE